MHHKLARSISATVTVTRISRVDLSRVIVLPIAFSFFVASGSPACFAESEGSGKNSVIDRDERHFIDEIDKYFEEFAEIHRFSQFSRTWKAPSQPGHGPELKSSISRAREKEASGKSFVACAEYLAVARDLINSNNPEAARPFIEKIVELTKHLDQTQVRIVIKALVDVAADSHMYLSREQLNVGSELLLGTALAIKDALRDHDDQLISLLMQLGAQRQSNKEYSIATENYKRALELLEETKSSDDNRLMACINALTYLYRKQNSEHKIELILRRHIDLIESSEKSKRLSAVPYLWQLQRLYSQTGREKESIAVIDKVLAIVDSENINQTLDKSEQRLGISIADQMKGYSNGPDQERVLKSAFKLKLRLQGFSSSIVFELRSLSQFLIRAGKSDEAVDLYKKAIKQARLMSDQQTADLLQNGLLVALDAAGKHDDKAQLEIEIKEKTAIKVKTTEAEALRNLSEARDNKNITADAHLLVLINASDAVLNSNKLDEARKLISESFELLRKTPDKSVNSSTFEQMWILVRNLYMRSEAKEDQQILFQMANLDEKRRAALADAFYSNAEMSYIVQSLLSRGKFGEAESLLEHLSTLQKQYRPNDLDALIETDKQLRSLYVAMNRYITVPPNGANKGTSAGISNTHQRKILELTAQIIELLESKYGRDDIKVLTERISLAGAYAQQGKIAQVDETLDLVYSRIQNASPEKTEGTDRPDQSKIELRILGPKLAKVAEVFLLSGNIAAAEKVTRKSIAISFNEDLNSIINADRIVKAYETAGDYARAADFVSYRLQRKELGFGEDSLEASQQRLQLSELFFKLSRNYAIQGKKSLAEDWAKKSEAEYQRALAAFQRVNGVDSPDVQEAKRRRDHLVNPVSPNIPTGDDVT